ncbi:MAG: endonuclease V [Thermodesulfovibrionales bacterium]|nr:endonuclease V [Thermodesulfovibrionales bacterium]
MVFNIDLKELQSKLWAENLTQAKEIQNKLKKKIQIFPLTKEPTVIAGVDASFLKDYVIAVASFFFFPELIHIENTHSIEKAKFPYIPGFLSFREGLSIISALNKSKYKPDLIIFDGQGIAHPRGFGIASHLGVILNLPTIGCAKSRLVGSYLEPPLQRGGYSSLIYNNEKVGIVLRTKKNAKPLFVSPGHLIDIESSKKVILSSTTNYRIPEPLRLADRLSKELRKKLL